MAANVVVLGAGFGGLELTTLLSAPLAGPSLATVAEKRDFAAVRRRHSR